MELKMSNPLRDQLVKNMIAQHPGEPLTVENFAPYFADLPNFDLGDDDLEQYAEAAAEQAIEFEGAPEPLAQPIKAPETVAESVKPVPGTPEEIEAATIRRLDADKTLANARVAIMAAQHDERDARNKLAKAVSAFQSGFAPITSQELRTQFVKEQQEIRRAIAAGEMPGRPGPKIGKSAVDRAAYYQRGGTPTGGGRAYARGALPASVRGRVFAPKVPSER
jgi:hypothetical protein